MNKIDKEVFLWNSKQKMSFAPEGKRIHIVIHQPKLL